MMLRLLGVDMGLNCGMFENTDYLRTGKGDVAVRRCQTASNNAKRGVWGLKLPLDNAFWINTDPKYRARTIKSDARYCGRSTGPLLSDKSWEKPHVILVLRDAASVTANFYKYGAMPKENSIMQKRGLMYGMKRFQEEQQDAIEMLMKFDFPVSGFPVCQLNQILSNIDFCLATLCTSCSALGS
jgi:hypothetical protein